MVLMDMYRMEYLWGLLIMAQMKNMVYFAIKEQISY